MVFFNIDGEVVIMKIKKRVFVSAASVAAIALFTGFSANAGEENIPKYSVFIGTCAVCDSIDENYVEYPTLSMRRGYNRADLPCRDIYDSQEAENGLPYDRICTWSICTYYMNDVGYCMEGTHIDCDVVESAEDHVVLNFSGIGVKEDGSEEVVNDYWGLEVGKIMNDIPTYYVPLTNYEISENAENYAKVVHA